MTIHHRLLAAICSLLLFGAACSSTADTATAELPTLADTTEETTADGVSDDDDGPEAEVSAADEDQATDEGTSGSDGDDEEVDPEIAMAEYEKCMADQGIVMNLASAEGGAAIESFDAAPDDSDGGNSPEEFGMEDFEAAAEICEPLLEEAFGSFEMTPEQEAEMADEMLELNRCLSDAGFDIDMTGNAFQLDENIDFEAFEEAMSTCGSGFESIDSDR